MIQKLKVKLKKNTDLLQNLEKKKENLEKQISELQTKIQRQELQVQLLELSPKARIEEANTPET